MNWPITGTIAGGYFSFTATNPGCATALASNVGRPGCNYLYGNGQNSLGNSDTFGQANPYPTSGYRVTKPADRPTSETTMATGYWDQTGGGAAWNQTLAPNSPSGEFGARIVYEYAGTGTGYDTCWFAGSSYAPLKAIATPGYGWSVISDNTWGSDFVGWTLAAVRYYRQKKRVPCGARFYQQMVIDAAYDPNNPSGYARYVDNQGATIWAIPYSNNNVLGGDITATTVTSTRAGQTITNTKWK